MSATPRADLVVHLLAALITVDADRVRQRPREAVQLASSLVDAVMLHDARESFEEETTPTADRLFDGVCVLGYQNHRWGGPQSDIRCVRCGARDDSKSRRSVLTAKSRARRFARLREAV